MFNQLNIQQLSIKVEQTYNSIQALYLSNDYSQWVDDKIELLKIDYYNDLFTLKSMGIGGVLIGKHFRHTGRE